MWNTDEYSQYRALYKLFHILKTAQYKCCTCGPCYLFWNFGGASAVAPWVARFEGGGWGFVKTADRQLAAAQRRRTNLRVHRCNVMRKALHGVIGPSGKVMSHGKVHRPLRKSRKSVNSTVVNQSQRHWHSNEFKFKAKRDLKTNVIFKMMHDHCLIWHLADVIIIMLS